MSKPQKPPAFAFLVLACAACAASPEPKEPAAPIEIAAPAPSTTTVTTTAQDEASPIAGPAEPPPAPALSQEIPAPSPWLAGAAGPATITLSAGSLVLPEPLQFETGKPVLHASSASLLDSIAAYLESKPEITRLRIEGHTDDRGSAEFNRKLSGERALAVARALVKRRVDCRRLIPVTFGETRPIVPNTTPEGREKNRRIDLVIAELRGKPILGRPLDGGGTVSGDPCQ